MKLINSSLILTVIAFNFIACGKLKTDVSAPSPGQIACTTEVMLYPITVNAFNSQGQPLVNARVGFISIPDLINNILENDGSCIEQLPGKYVCNIHGNVYQEYLAVQNSSAQDTFGVSVAKSGYQSQFAQIQIQDITDPICGYHGSRILPESVSLSLPNLMPNLIMNLLEPVTIETSQAATVGIDSVRRSLIRQLN